LCVGEREGTRRCGDYSDKALTDAQPRPMHGFRPESLGGEEFENFAGAHNIGRAHFCHHLGGNDANNAVEPFLCGPGTGHDIPKAAQKTAGATDAR
jgi:hypothetical protein